jgi:O-antigen/teichoic acid export membrane protein
VLLERLVGLREVGIYSVGYTFGMIMSIVAEGAVGSAWPPFFMSFVNRRSEAAQVFGRVFKYCVVGLGTLTLAFFVFARPVVAVMTAPAFHTAYTVVGLVAAAYMLKVCYLVMLPPLYFERKLHLQAAVEWGAAALNLALNLLLIPVLRKEGAALGTLLAYLSLPTAAYLLGRRYLRVEYEWRSLGKFAIVLVATAAAAYFVDVGSIWLNFVVGGAILVAFAAVVYASVLTDAERSAVLRTVEAMRGRVLGRAV